MTLRLLLAVFLTASGALAQDHIRIATYNVGLGRDGPGLLLKDIQSSDEDILAIVQIIGITAPDVLLLTNFDNDYNNVALSEFLSLIRAETALDFPYFFSTGGNAGLPSGLDLNGNGQLGDWRDNWGFGRFEGNESMVFLSRYPITAHREFDHFLWRNLPDAMAPTHPDGADFFPPDVWNVIRLSSQSHWDLTLDLSDGVALHLLATHATPPVFDGPEDLNGLRNDAEIGFWLEYLNGAAFEDDFGNITLFTAANFVLLGDLNADPDDGESIGTSLRGLLHHPKLTDPLPQSIGGRDASQAQAGANTSQTGDPLFDTADWADADLGNLRVDYVLPSANLTVEQSGVFWPILGDPDYGLLEAAKTAHRLVWVDILLP
ncbi:MAG: endonuclease/exonuclease/phosphatase family protein [Rhodobacteraceae bacterium]|nr:endonuclease/exonuclease/phosphatase family protein [Paracoccaceae bacterium]